MTIEVPKNEPPYEYCIVDRSKDGSCTLIFVTREHVLRTYKPSQHALTDDDVVDEFLCEHDAERIE